SDGDGQQRCRRGRRRGGQVDDRRGQAVVTGDGQHGQHRRRLAHAGGHLVARVGQGNRRRGGRRGQGGGQGRDGRHRRGQGRGTRRCSGRARGDVLVHGDHLIARRVVLGYLDVAEHGPGVAGGRNGALLRGRAGCARRRRAEHQRVPDARREALAGDRDGGAGRRRGRRHLDGGRGGGRGRLGGGDGTRGGEDQAPRHGHGDGGDPHGPPRCHAHSHPTSCARPLRGPPAAWRQPRD